MKKLILMLTVMLAACASTNEALMRESASSIGGKASPDAVKVRNVDRGVTTVKWEAETAEGVYSCWADDMLRHTKCAPVK